MEAKHTKGPWFVEHYGNKPKIPWVVAGKIGYSDRNIERVDFTGPQIAKLQLTEQRAGGLDSYPEESEANARLIAAAPDLLEALRWIVEFIHEHPEWDDNYFREHSEAHAESDWFEAAQKAVAKAENF